MSVQVLEHDKLQPTIGHVETRDEKVTDADSSGLMKSPVDHLSIWQTLWIFKRVVMFVILVYTGYVCEGFEVGWARERPDTSSARGEQSLRTGASSSSSAHATRLACAPSTPLGVRGGLYTLTAADDSLDVGRHA